jgi:hypothetical protein
MRIYDRENKRVDFPGRTSCSTPVVNHRCPRSEGSPMRELIVRNRFIVAVVSHERLRETCIFVLYFCCER